MLNHKIAISTLSPIHIGCDTVYEPSNFVIHDDLLHALDVADLAEELSAAERKQLGDLATNGREPIGAIQRFFRERAERLASIATHHVAVADDIASEYAQKAGVAAQRNVGSDAVYNSLAIARTAFSPIDNAPYLPGSSLKGSIRTAWLDHLNDGDPLRPNEKPQDKKASRATQELLKKTSRIVQERLMKYAANEFQNDPFRHVAIADAKPDDAATPPPTLVLYVVSKKKRVSERDSPGVPGFLETIPEAMPARFLGDLRLGEAISWAALCDACNQFYRPQLDEELSHPVLRDLLDVAWKMLINDLLREELDALIKARQGFLLRVGRHSGAESVTLNGIRHITILGKDKKDSELRPNTTEKRFASRTKRGIDGLLPFGWVWVDGSDQAHQSLSDSLKAKLAKRSAPALEAHADRLARSEAAQEERHARRLTALQAQNAAIEAKQAEDAAQVQRQQMLASLSPGQRQVEEFIAAAGARVESLRGGHEKMNAAFHNRARALALEALAGADWSKEERAALATAIAHWLPQVVSGIDKDQLKKLKLSALRGE